MNDIVVFLHEKRGAAGTNFYFKSPDGFIFYRCSIKFEWFPGPHHTGLYRVDIPDPVKEKFTQMLGEFKNGKYVMPKKAFESIGMSILITDDMCEKSGIPKDLCWLCQNKEPGVLATEAGRHGRPQTH